MKVLVTGKGGQLAWELEQTKPETVELIALSRQELDISDAEAVNNCINSTKPDVIINAAAYTAVDAAQSDQDTAFAVNSIAVKNLATASPANTPILHVSTDFVFDGSSSTPYQPDDNTAPQSVYGESKWQGEQHLRELKPDCHAIIRTSWVYSSHGNNFVKTMLRLMNDKPELGIVADQIGAPTWAKGLARACWASIECGLKGTYHYSDAGTASWYDFAHSIHSIGLDLGLVNSAIPIKPIKTSAYPTPAVRPAFSLMDSNKLIAATRNSTNKFQHIHWRDQLIAMMQSLPKPT